MGRRAATLAEWARREWLKRQEEDVLILALAGLKHAVRVRDRREYREKQMWQSRKGTPDEVPLSYLLAELRGETVPEGFRLLDKIVGQLLVER